MQFDCVFVSIFFNFKSMKHSNCLYKYCFWLYLVHVSLLFI